MLRRLRLRLTYANVVSTLCLFILLGGTAWAVAANSVGTAQLKDGAVTNPKLAVNAVGTGKVIDGSLLARDVKPGALASAAAHYATFDNVIRPTGANVQTKTLITKGPFRLTADCIANSQTEVAAAVHLYPTVEASGTTYTNAQGSYGFGREASTVVPVHSYDSLLVTYSAYHDPSTFYWYGGAPVSFISDSTALDGVLSYGTGGYHTCEISFFGG